MNFFFCYIVRILIVTKLMTKSLNKEKKEKKSTMFCFVFYPPTYPFLEKFLRVPMPILISNNYIA